MALDRTSFFLILLSFLQVCAYFAAMGKLLWTRLVATYPWLSLYVGVVLATPIARVLFHSQDAVVFRLSQGLQVVLAVSVLWELVRIGFDGYGALGKFIRKASWVMIGAALVIAFANWGLDPTVPEGRSPLLHETLAMFRAASSGLLAYLFLVIGFMAWFPVRMRRNVAILLLGFVGVFIGDWFTAFVNNLAPDHGDWADILAIGIQMVCAVAWATLLSRTGEQTQTITGHRWNHAEMIRLSEKLDSINASLARSGR